jgi:hypothetical protein
MFGAGASAWIVRYALGEDMFTSVFDFNEEVFGECWSGVAEFGT